MFVDELTIDACAGNGGNGVVRWLRARHLPKGGPAGGNGGRGGDVYIRGVRDVGLLAKYTGEKVFTAQNGAPGEGRSKTGKDGEDCYIDLPIGSTITDRTKKGRVYTLTKEGEVHKILSGGGGGFGNEYFKSSTNRSPKEATPGKEGEKSTFHIELSLVVDVGFIGFPNAGKSTLLNALTNATAAVGAYPFTTLEPHLGDFYGFILADIPGLIEGASKGKGLGHKFLRHVQKTNMLLHLISLEHEDVLSAYTTIRKELAAFDTALTEKDEWVVLTKTDLASKENIEQAKTVFIEQRIPVFTVSVHEKGSIKVLQDALSMHLHVQK